jgi:hypothetical protein
MACIVLLPYGALSLQPSGSKAVWFALWAFLGGIISYWLAPLAGYLFYKVACRGSHGANSDLGPGHPVEGYSPTPFPERLLRSLLLGALGFVTYYLFFR